MFESLRNEKRPPYTAPVFSADLKAGITLSANYVPTAMALGVISGLGPLAGLWCGVLVGFVAAACGGTRALVSGPSAVLAVITATLVTGNQYTADLPSHGMAAPCSFGLGIAGMGVRVLHAAIVLTGSCRDRQSVLERLQAVPPRRSDLAIAGGLVLMPYGGSRAGNSALGAWLSRSAGSDGCSCPAPSGSGPSRPPCLSVLCDASLAFLCGSRRPSGPFVAPHTLYTPDVTLVS